MSERRPVIPTGIPVARDTIENLTAENKHHAISYNLRLK